MTKYIENSNYKLILNSNTGLIEGLYNKNDKDQGNILISTKVLEDLNFDEQKHRLLGSSLYKLKYSGQEKYEETGYLPVSDMTVYDTHISVIKRTSDLEFTYNYSLMDDGLKWTASIRTYLIKLLPLVILHTGYLLPYIWD